MSVEADAKETPAEWNLYWSAGIGYAFTPFLGLRLTCARTGASGLADGETLAAAGSAWMLQFLID